MKSDWAGGKELAPEHRQPTPFVWYMVFKEDQSHLPPAPPSHSSQATCGSPARASGLDVGAIQARQLLREGWQEHKAAGRIHPLSGSRGECWSSARFVFFSQDKSLAPERLPYTFRVGLRTSTSPVSSVTYSEVCLLGGFR